MKRLSQMGLLLAAALIMSYIEALIPLTVGIPGMKLGLPNAVILFILYWKDFNHMQKRSSSFQRKFEMSLNWLPF